MKGIEKLRIKGLRRIGDAEIQLGPLTVLIGANGSGKTSVLDAFRLVEAAAHGRLSERVNELGGFTALATSGIRPGMELELDFQQNEAEQCAYQLGLGPAGVSYAVFSERLTVSKGQMSAPLDLVRYEQGVLLYSSGERRTFDSVDASRLTEAFLSGPQISPPWSQFLGAVRFHKSPSVASNSPIRQPQNLQETDSPGVDGASLNSLLYRIRDSKPERFEFVEDTIRAAFPSFRRLEIPPAGGRLALAWRDSGFTEPFYAHQLSDGQLRFLALVALLNSPNPPTVLLIDEPEDSLHPELLSLLVDLFREASARTQVVVATHSDRLVSFLTPEEVVAVDLDESGMARFTSGSDLNLAEWLEDYTLGQLWTKGLLGGRS